MKGDQIPEKDHSVRQCGGATVHEDGTIDGGAFRLRNLHSHCGIFGLDADDDLIADLIAEAVREIYPARG